ncbi:hypothetical protein CTI12_AA173360 [Artemisia annua]|uniref:Uncharacterized protein n=1 Tax=Artemisia annua TaxID=35608 RepID=A0A2U1PBG1_ARTAN|nr:hypothetical protein CTI12_AA173360 [Artemisia annua]
MAFAIKSLSLLLCLLLLVLQLSDGFNGAEKTISCVTSLKDINSRKLLVVKGLEAKREAVFKIVEGKSTRKVENDGWELRAAPLGPDPLHHHGADPKKPRTP